MLAHGSDNFEPLQHHRHERVTQDHLRRLRQEQNDESQRLLDLRVDHSLEAYKGRVEAVELERHEKLRIVVPDYQDQDAEVAKLRVEQDFPQAPEKQVVGEEARIRVLTRVRRR